MKKVLNADVTNVVEESLTGYCGAGLAMLNSMGGAQAGDKTMVDALVPVQV